MFNSFLLCYFVKYYFEWNKYSIFFIIPTLKTELAKYKGINHNIYLGQV